MLECFYGPLWSGSDRARVLEVARAAGATDYVYGPAADERTGGRWREPYAADEEALQDLNARAASLGVRTTWRVSPGAPLDPARGVECSSIEDQRLLRERIRDAAALGFSRVLVAFDDVSAALSPADRAAFGHDPHPLAAAHATMLNLAARAAEEHGLSFLVCPMHYWGVTPSAYRRRLADLLHTDVPVCWTGPGVTSRTISARDAADVAEQWARPLWLWDNYPVNDWDGITRSFDNDTAPRRLPLRALRGRDAALAGVLAGYGTNAALDPLVTLPATVTALRWAADPAAYEPDGALAEAAIMLGLDPEAIAVLAELCGAAPVDEAPGAIMALIASTMAAPSRAEHARQDLGQLALALEGLRDDPGFGSWVAAARGQLDAATFALGVLVGEEAHDGRLAASARALRAEPRAVAHGAMTTLVDWVLGMMGAPAPQHPDELDG
ncbi:beta-N-acetylglucosaminidase [Tessaracoccus oleiagri]|uniref:Beta-N-acetylglucosaminidase n=1 Tax=Tessaracoccus oleiagri TaxID=686624 RepID=A0A1G9HIN9_9ACTN|nr:beta-N-acetylglucosaminidase [Tessaracoccus oleiagri]